MKALFTSEAVTYGHPDKLCDQTADAILDALLSADPMTRAACEVTACPDKLHIMGEVTSTCTPDYAAIARGVIRDIGYTRPGMGFDADTCNIVVDLHEQSPDISQGVSRETEDATGAGDQGMMFGFACDETPCLMPLPITLANRLARSLERARREGDINGLGPDGKAQVTVEYAGDRPLRIDAVVMSAQHDEALDVEELRRRLLELVIKPALPEHMLDEATHYYINPTGRFVIGGPAGDSGLTGRKIIADTYGGYARHGGGSFSGKDATKVDRTGAYMARYLAKNIVAAGLAPRCEVQLAYAIGRAEPVSVLVDTFGTGKTPGTALSGWAMDNIDMRPAAMIRRLGLRRPVFRQLSCYGHFGENALDMPWEQTDIAELMRAALL